MLTVFSLYLTTYFDVVRGAHQGQFGGVLADLFRVTVKILIKQYKNYQNFELGHAHNNKLSKTTH